ncbi:MAG TPA: hypothetical protein VFE82_17595 [Ramlibacter sp.]|jgi:hypothetical protein|uniref:hypothetical protein n=1 Tax=Ramlibacter sp. TaxID=1917967 RepID=UPI002D2F15BA|nr:hypothetical protein [Ramlibacter sp.]HZY20288.1 hypothetical protein [Ramlibacter sp.]
MSATRALLVRAVLLVGLAVLATGCADMPHRPLVKANLAKGCDTRSQGDAPADSVTPIESANPPYKLHFLEFDDQGWSYSAPDNQPGMDDQVDCAIADLTQTLQSGKEVVTYVFVHGWHHSAEVGDRDLNRFRDLLAYQTRTARNRQVIGYYVGWNGATIKVPYVKDLTFWGRKNAAHHVSEGTIREFFARLKAVRDHYNRPREAKNCGSENARTDGFGCPVRTIMVGHSFGALILYSAASPYLLETLSSESQTDLDVKRPSTQRERGIADLVVLLNPAFEATRYEAVHRAAMRYRNRSYAPPLLISITSDADQATGVAFPVARFVNSIFQYPATSPHESEAMRLTHGHIDRYITHELTVDREHAAAASQTPSAADGPGPCTDAQGRPSDPAQLRREFFRTATTADGLLDLPPRWERRLCGGLQLRQVQALGSENYGLVWNVRTGKDIIPDHNRIDTRGVYTFIQQIYDEVSESRELRFRK